MSNAIDNLSGAVAAYGLDPRSGAFVNDTAPGADGSAIGVNTVPDSSEDASAQADGLTASARGRGLWIAAIGGGMLALGVALWGGRLWPRRSRLFMRRRPRWRFAR
jgi:hypothetical protein